MEFRIVYPNPFWAMGLGVIGLVKGAWHMWEGEGSTSWPTIQGKVRETRIEVRKEGKDDEYYEAIVEYEYQPRDQVIIATRWSYGDDNQFPTRHEAEHALTRYSEGMPVDVHYDPADPGRSVLVQGMGNDGMKAAFIGAGLFLFGLFVLLKFW